MSAVTTKPKPKKKTKRARFYGHVPNGRYDVLGFRHACWLLFSHRYPLGGWRNLKLVFRGAHSRRANFWIAWHQTEGRFADSTDFRELARNEPELLGELIGYLNRTPEAPPCPFD